MEKPRLTAKMLSIRYWPTWGAFGIWWVLSLLPYRIQMWLGHGLGKVFLVFAKQRRDIASRNIQLCFPSLTAQEQRSLLINNMASTGKAFFETGMAWFWPRWRLEKLYTLEGMENLDAVLSNGQGVLFAAIHSTTIDISGGFLTLSLTLDGFYRPHKNPVYEFFQARGREKHNREAHLIPKKDLRGVVKALRRGRIVHYPVDQDLGRKNSIFAPFFGVQAATLTSTSQLLRMGKACLVPYTILRKPNDAGYVVRIHPAFDNFPEDDELTNATRLNQFIEGCVAECPEQYLWVHRRFKTRPEGEASLY